MLNTTDIVILYLGLGVIIGALVILEIENYHLHNQLEETLKRCKQEVKLNYEKGYKDGLHFRVEKEVKGLQ